jgi:two-component system, NarL family, invasion response regulator UvrY
MNAHKPVKIAMVDDHILLRDALATVIDGFENCKVILLAAHGRELLEKLQPDNLPDLVILDLNMPELDGYETARYLRLHYPGVYVLILTMYDSEITLLRLLQAGARGFLKKDIHPGELKLAIQSVMSAGYFYSYNSAGKLVNLFKKDKTNNNQADRLSLSENELAFLKLASSDMTYKEIAAVMEISPRTVDNYRDALFLKLNVKSRVGLAIYAIKSGVITLEY